MRQKGQQGAANSATYSGRAYVVRVYSLLAAVTLGIFGALHVAQDQRALGVWELCGAAAILLNAFLLRTGRVRLVITAYLVIVLLFLGVMVVSGGTQQTGIFWFFVFPVVAFFLTDKREGLWWMALLCAMTLELWLLAAKGMISIPYDNITMRQLLLSVLVVAGGIYAYERSREQLQTQTSESRNELRIEQVRADVIIRDIGEGMAVTDASGRVVSMSRTAEALLGWKLDELKGKLFIEEVPMLDDAGNILRAEDRPLLQSLQTGRASTTTAMYKRKDGRSLPVSVTSTPIVVEGKTIGVASTFRDVSEEQSVLRAKSEFTTLASHQLRTPLSAILWTSELLLNGDAGKLTPEQHKYVEDIYESNRRMAALVSEMLMVSSLELGSLPVKPRPMHVDTFAAKVLRDQAKEHVDKKMHIVEHLAADLPELAYDPSILRLLLRTLFSNAFKYTPEGGTITLSVSISKTADRWLRIEVGDTGYGIPAADTSHIFGKFFRASNVVTKDTDGTGLGLYIVKRLLDYVGGRISFASQEGKGATFTMLLPLAGMTPRQPQQNTEVQWEGVGDV